MSGRAVAVHIGHQAATRPAVILRAARLGHVLKGAVPVVQIQSIGADVRDVQIGSAVVIKVADRRPHAQRIVPQAGRPGRLFKSPVAQVPKQAVLVLRRLSGCWGHEVPWVK